MATRKKPPVSKPTSTASRVPRNTVRSKVASGTSDGGTATTVVFIHGIGNKPLPQILKCQWDEALFGFGVGERSRLACWVNRLFYPQPVQASCKSPDIAPGEKILSCRAGARRKARDALYVHMSGTSMGAPHGC